MRRVFLFSKETGMARRRRRGKGKAARGGRPRLAATAGPWRRDPALAVRRELRGALPDAGLRLRHRRAGRGALQGRGPGLHLFALRQPDGRHVRGADAPPRRRRAARATASGMAAVTAVFLSWLKAGDHVVAAKALFGSCRYVIEELLPRFGIASTLVDGTDLDQWRDAVGPSDQGVLPGEPDQPDAGDHRHRGGREDRAQGGRPADRRQRLRHAALPAAAGARRRYRGLFRDQAYRRPGPLPRRRHPRRREVHRRQRPHVPPPDRTVAQPVQRLGAAEGAGDVCRYGSSGQPDGGADRRSPRGAEGL